MNKLSRFAKLSIASTAGALIIASLAACTHSPNPNARKVLMACLAVTNIDAGQILGTQITAMKLSGENSPIHVCAYDDAKGDTLALLQITKSESKDPAGDLTADAAKQKALFKANIVPIQIHPADGFGAGAFYLDNTLNPTATSVQLHIIENGYLMMAQINNPKDFATGEKQAAAIAQKAFARIQDKSALQVVL